MKSGLVKGLAIGLAAAALAGGGVWLTIGLLEPKSVGIRIAGEGAQADSSSPQATPVEEEDGPYFEAFWPVTTLNGAKELQSEVDAGRELWRTNPVEVTKAFVKQRFGWGGTVEIENSPAESRVDSFTSEVKGSSSEGWAATVTFKHRFIRGSDPGGGFVHNVYLMGLPDTERPAWLVTGIVGDWMKIDSPPPNSPVASPLRASGSGNGFEAQIDVAVEDDSGAERGTGFAMGGAYEPAPFRAEIPFSSPTTIGGRIVFTPSSGAEGPPPFASIVRVKFAEIRGPGSEASPSPANEQKTREVVVYYLAESGGRMNLVRERHTVGDTPRIATRALDELIHGTPAGPANFSPYPRSTQIRSVTISDRIATVDFSAEVLEANVGAEVESIGIQAAVWTLTEFPTIEKVRFTVEGRERGTASNGRVIEDWWGHVGLYEQPFIRDRSIRPS
jgi:hypothetical protein